jgi:hypothetical protein
MKNVGKGSLKLDFSNRDFHAPSLAKKILEQGKEKELVTIALGSDQIVGNRAMWVLAHCAEIEPKRIRSFHITLVNHLKNEGIHSGIIRSILHIFQHQDIPKQVETFLLEKCFEYVQNSTQAIAVRVFAMTVIFNISKPYPELLNELYVLLSKIIETEESAGIKSRARAVLKEIAKMKMGEKANTH